MKTNYTLEEKIEFYKGEIAHTILILNKATTPYEVYYHSQRLTWLSARLSRVLAKSFREA